MSLITQYSRISHHTLYGLTAGTTFSVPTTTDFTDGSWTIKDLALSEIGVNESDKKVYIRIDNEIKEFQLAGGTSSAEPLSTTLVAGNTTGANWINVDSGYGLTSSGGSITDTISLDTINGIGIKSENTITGQITSIIVSPDTFDVSVTDGVTTTGIQQTADDLTLVTGDTLLYMTQGDGYFQSVDTASTVKDMFILDPQGLGNGTGIKSEDTTTGDYSYVNVNPTGIVIYQEDITNTQNRYITLQPSQISLVCGPNAILIDEAGELISLSSNLISIGSADVKNIISTGAVTTTNATVTTIHTFNCVNSGPKSYKVRVIGYKGDYSKSYLGELFGLYNYDGATVTLINSLDLVEKTSFTTATSTISISGTDIIIEVTGEAATTIYWSVYVEMNDVQ
ncbi:MAG: hypothetical protein ACOVK2_02960 [Candidatus Fonsibacter sp.]